jgi:hypothetical protein
LEITLTAWLSQKRSLLLVRSVNFLTITENIIENKEFGQKIEFFAVDDLHFYESLHLMGVI